MSKRAVLYARVSGDDRAKTGGENLQDQLRVCREYAERKGYQVIAELAEDDRGISGATADPPQLSKALDMARARVFDILIVREVDRLARDIGKQYRVEGDLKRDGVKVEYALYDFPDTMEGKLQKTIYAAFAEFERGKISERMTRGRRRKVKEGNVLTGHIAPFGYCIVYKDGKRTIEIVEEEAKVVRRIFEWYTVGDGENGPLSGNAIANKLTAMQTPTVTEMRGQIVKGRVRKPNTWAQSSVATILKRETYAGTWYYCKKSEHDPIPVEVPAIIDRETWKAAQVRKKKNRQQSKRNTKMKYLMRGRLRCPSCRRKLHAYSYKTGKVYAYYRCHSRFDNTPCDNPWNYPSKLVDAAVWEWISKLLSDPTELENGLNQYQAEREKIIEPLRESLEGVDTLIAEKKAKLDRLLDLYLSGDFEKEALTEHKRRIEGELARLQEERARLAQQIKEQEFSEERLQAILEFSQAIGAGIKVAETNFEKRRAIVEALDVTGELETKNGERILHLTCVMGGEEMQIASKTINGWTGSRTISTPRSSSR